MRTYFPHDPERRIATIVDGDYILRELVEIFGNRTMQGASLEDNAFVLKSYVNGIFWQRDYHGNHRLMQVFANYHDNKNVKVGDWAFYESPAILQGVRRHLVGNHFHWIPTNFVILTNAFENTQFEEETLMLMEPVGE